MGSLVHICSGTCHKCTRKEFGPDWKEQGEDHVTSTFHLVRAMVTVGRTAGEVLDCWECVKCRELVPVDGWRRYQETGDILVRTKKGKVN